MSYLPSILLLSENVEDFLTTNFNINLSTNNLDLQIIESEKSIGISDVKTAQKFAQSIPVKSDKKIIVFKQAEKLTTEAQNALLKLLEEPPAYLILILSSQSTHQFLPTLISRCQIIKGNHLQKTIKTTDAQELQQLCQSKIESRLNLLPSTANKEVAIEYCSQLINQARYLLKNGSIKTAHNLEVLTTCLNQLHQNANPTLAISDAVLRLIPIT